MPLKVFLPPQPFRSGNPVPLGEGLLKSLYKKSSFLKERDLQSRPKQKKPLSQRERGWGEVITK